MPEKAQITPELEAIIDRILNFTFIKYDQWWFVYQINRSPKYQTKHTLEAVLQIRSDNRNNVGIVIHIFS